MAHVFISYSRVDQDFARQIVTDLQQAGITVWWDQINIQPGENWDVAVENGLKAANAVVVILSPDSMASQNVRNEVNFARDNDQLLLPILHRAAQVILNLETINWIDLSTPELYQANFKRLATHLTTLDNAKDDLAIEVSQGNLTVANDTRQVSKTQLRHYLKLLGVIAAPLDDSTTIDINLAWRNLANAVVTAYQLSNMPYALVRLAPPTIEKLGAVLSDESYPIVHLIANSEGDKVHFEDENGLPGAVDSEKLAEAFAQSQTELLVVRGMLAESVAQTLLAKTPLKGVIYNSTPLPEDANTLFDSRFYGALASGQGIKAAFDKALETLKTSHAQIVETFHLHLKDGLTEVNIALPPNHAEKPLIDPSLPRTRNVPINSDFVGQSLPLKTLLGNANQSNTRQVTIYGIGGVGKSWLASEFVARFGWRYSDGILWMHICEQTKSEDIIGQLLALLELPASTSLGDLRNILRNRRVLIVLDQANEWIDHLEVGELADFVSRLDTVGGTRLMITAWAGVEPLTRTVGTREFILNEMSASEADTLIQRLIKSHELEAEFAKVENGIPEFTEKTLYTPWLIQEAMQLVKLDGLESTLQDLEALSEDVSDILERYVGRQVQHISPEVTAFLRKLQGIPDSFDYAMAKSLGGSDTRQHLRELLRRNLLRRDGSLYSLPATVRAYLRQYHLLREEEQDQIDEALIKHMLTGASQGATS